MSVGDRNGARRRIKQLKSAGHYPKPSGLTAHQLSAKHKERAALEAKRKAGSKK
jgi:hypothetical protein